LLLILPSSHGHARILHASRFNSSSTRNDIPLPSKSLFTTGC
jgi:hypothetical protein